MLMKMAPKYIWEKEQLIKNGERDGKRREIIKKKKNTLSNKDCWHNKEKSRGGMLRIKARRWRKAKGIKNNEEKWKCQNAEQRDKTHTHIHTHLRVDELSLYQTNCHSSCPYNPPILIISRDRPLMTCSILQMLHSPLWAIFLTSNYHCLWFVLSSQKVVIRNFF